ncbi:MAG: PfkB family carbohydrate kinase, partial [Chloroflexota bacterium]
TTGAGDASYAALMTAMLRGMTPDEAVKMACAVGAHNVEAAGAVGGLKSWDETVARVEAGWPISETILEL